MTTVVAKGAKARARFDTPDAQGAWVLVQATIGLQPSQGAPARETWNGIPIVRLEELTPENHPFESEDDTGDYFRA